MVHDFFTSICHPLICLLRFSGGHELQVCKTEPSNPLSWNDLKVRILVIEDDEQISEIIQQGLEEAGYKVDVARDGATGLDMAETQAYSTLVLDVMLPKMDGWEVCKSLRASRNTVPILMLTARDSIPDRVHGLEIGADDYLPKPFHFSELLARVRALLRRDQIHKGRVIRIYDLEIDTTQRIVKRGGSEISLTPREYTLLEALAAREGRVLTRDLILEQVWMNDESYSNTVDV
ncbi:MAG TPA: response regulator transcription factor, partial [Chthonomonadales bacterium]|nr:response regulator transcription factor [Chthonomonadales bacterium]